MRQRRGATVRRLRGGGGRHRSTRGARRLLRGGRRGRRRVVDRGRGLRGGRRGRRRSGHRGRGLRGRRRRRGGRRRVGQRDIDDLLVADGEGVGLLAIDGEDRLTPAEAGGGGLGLGGVLGERDLGAHGEGAVEGDRLTGLDRDGGGSGAALAGGLLALGSLPVRVGAGSGRQLVGDVDDEAGAGGLRGSIALDDLGHVEAAEAGLHLDRDVEVLDVGLLLSAGQVRAVEVDGVLVGGAPRGGDGLAVGVHEGDGVLQGEVSAVLERTGHLVGGGAAVLGVGGLDVVVTVLGGGVLAGGVGQRDGLAVSRTQVEDRAGGVSLVEGHAATEGVGEDDALAGAVEGLAELATSGLVGPEVHTPGQLLVVVVEAGGPLGELPVALLGAADAAATGQGDGRGDTVDGEVNGLHVGGLGNGHQGGAGPLEVVEASGLELVNLGVEGAGDVLDGQGAGTDLDILAAVLDGHGVGLAVLQVGEVLTQTDREGVAALEVGVDAAPVEAETGEVVGVELSVLLNIVAVHPCQRQVGDVDALVLLSARLRGELRQDRDKEESEDGGGPPHRPSREGRPRGDARGHCVHGFSGFLA